MCYSTKTNNFSPTKQSLNITSVDDANCSIYQKVPFVEKLLLWVPPYF